MDTTASSSRSRLVVVDDDDGAREPFAEFLRLRGFSVDEFEEAEKALDAIAGDMPAVVLMDLTLADGMDGYEAARRIRAMGSAVAVRLVALTGHPAASVAKAGALFDAILTKPVDCDEVVALMHRFASSPRGGGGARPR